MASDLLSVMPAPQSSPVSRSQREAQKHEGAFIHVFTPEEKLTSRCPWTSLRSPVTMQMSQCSSRPRPQVYFPHFCGTPFNKDGDGLPIW